MKWRTFLQVWKKNLLNLALFCFFHSLWVIENFFCLFVLEGPLTWDFFLFSHVCLCYDLRIRLWNIRYTFTEIIYSIPIGRTLKLYWFYTICRAMRLITDTLFWITFPEQDMYKMNLSSCAMILSSYLSLCDKPAFSVSSLFNSLGAAKHG